MFFIICKQVNIYCVNKITTMSTELWGIHGDQSAALFAKYGFVVVSHDLLHPCNRSSRKLLVLSWPESVSCSELPCSVSRLFSSMFVCVAFMQISCHNPFSLEEHHMWSKWWKILPLKCENKPLRIIFIYTIVGAAWELNLLFEIDWLRKNKNNTLREAKRAKLNAELVVSVCL